MSTVLKHIPLASIRENPSALRSVNRQNEEYLGLVDSVKNKGVLNPVLVRELKGDGGESLYGLVDGLHRYTASLDAGLKDIPAQVINMDDASVMEAQLIGNIHKVETKPVEYSKLLQKILVMNPLLSSTQLAARLNKSTTWLSERLGLTKLSEPIQELVDTGKVNLSNAYMLAKLPPEEQASFIDRAMSMSPQEFTPTVLARKKEIDTAKRQGRDPKAAEFVPVANLQKLSELKTEMETISVGKAHIKEFGIKTPEEAWAAAVRWTLRLDPHSVKAAKEKDDVRKAELKKKQETAALERAKRKAEEAAAKAAELSTQSV